MKFTEGIQREKEMCCSIYILQHIGFPLKMELVHSSVSSYILYGGELTSPKWRRSFSSTHPDNIVQEVHKHHTELCELSELNKIK